MAFVDFSVQCKDLIAEAGIAWLYEASGEIQAQTKRNSRVDTGQTKGSYDVVVDESALVGHIGSNEQNAIWEEFGTGEYALHGDGRKGGWTYMDDKGEFHHTKGKTPNRPLFNAFNRLKPKCKNRAKEIFKQMGGGR